MDGREFYDRLQTHALLEWLGSRPARPAKDGEPGAPDRVFMLRRDTGMQWCFPVAEVLAHPWTELEGVLLGRRPATIMMRYTRIVGYYSNTANWNRSKLVELRDRGVGVRGYAVPDKTRDMDGDTPPEVMKLLAATPGAEMACDLEAVE